MCGGVCIGQLATGILIASLIVCTCFTGCIGGKTLPVSRPAAPAVLIDYHRSGGTAGLDDRLVIFDNGAAIVSTKTGSKEIVLNSTEVSRISDLFDEVSFLTLQDNYPAFRGANLFRYSIRYQDKTVTLDETGIPDTVKPVISELDRVIADSGA